MSEVTLSTMPTMPTDPNTMKTNTAPSATPMTPVSSVLKAANEITSKEERLQYLKDHDSKALRLVLQGSYDSNVVSLLPDGEPPFNPVPEHQRITLHDVVGQLPNIFKYGPMSNQPLTKVEFFFMDLLKKLETEEAKVLVRMKDKLLQQMYKRITKPLVKEFLSDTVEIR